jgi:hypothetical protein
MKIQLRFGEFYVWRDHSEKGFIIISAKTEDELLKLVKYACRQMVPGFRMNLQDLSLLNGSVSLRVNKIQWPTFYRYFLQVAPKQLTRMEPSDFVATLMYLPGQQRRVKKSKPQSTQIPDKVLKTVKEFSSTQTPAKDRKEPSSSHQAIPVAPLFQESDFPIVTIATENITAALLAMIPQLSASSFCAYESDGYHVLPSRNPIFVDILLLLKEKDFLISVKDCDALERKIGSREEIGKQWSKVPPESPLSFHLTRLVFSQIIHSYNAHLGLIDRIEQLFDRGFLLYLLNRLSDSRPDLQRLNSTCSLMREDYNSGIFDGATKDLVRIGREDGRFRSLCNEDDYGDESNSNDHDNEWYDR